MKIAISSAKLMRDYPQISYMSKPVYSEQAKRIRDTIVELNDDEKIQMWKCSQKIMEENKQRYLAMDFRTDLTPALFAYDGMQYTYIDAEHLSSTELKYLEERLYIISALYGPLRSFDGIQKYRLEMVNKVPGINATGSLYQYWGETILDIVRDDIILNLCSKEYGQVLTKFKKKDDHIVDVVFVDHILNEGTAKEKLVTISVTSKRGRGIMVSQLAKRNIQSVDEIHFDIPGFVYDLKRSNSQQIVYIRKIDNDWPLL